MTNSITLLRKLIALGLMVALTGCDFTLGKSPDPIKVAVLHSLTGTMAISEVPVANATLLAIEQVNAEGGIGGSLLQPILVDSRSDSEHAASEAKRLIREEGVVVVFGCWTSSCRKAVRPVVEQHRSLLVYPLQYEGLEHSPHILYTGLAPNQQILPSLSWLAENVGSRVYLLGSDYVFPRTANLIIREYAKAIGLEILGESYLPLGSEEVGRAVEEINRLRPDAVINTVNGDSNLAFFRALSAHPGVGAQHTKVLSMSVTEAETSQAPVEMQGHYAAWSYFQSMDLPGNRAFIAAYHQRFGNDAPISDPMVTAHLGVRLWAQAAKRVNSTEPKSVVRALARQSLDSPLGVVAVDPETYHLWRPLRVGKVGPDGQFSVIWSSKSPLRPKPYPILHTEKVWGQLQTDALARGRY